MSRLIDADALKSRIERMWKSRQLTNTKYKTFIELLDAEPTIEPERKKGKWIPHNTHFTFPTGETSDGGAKCSSCGFETHNKLHKIFGCPYKYCPNCGADMRGDSDETD